MVFLLSLSGQDAEIFQLSGQWQTLRGLVRRRPRAVDPLLPILRRMGRQEPRQDHPGRRPLLLLHQARARWRLWPDHPMELPFANVSFVTSIGFLILGK